MSFSATGHTSDISPHATHLCLLLLARHVLAGGHTSDAAALLAGRCEPSGSPDAGGAAGQAVPAARTALCRPRCGGAAARAGGSSCWPALGLAAHCGTPSALGSSLRGGLTLRAFSGLPGNGGALICGR